MSQCCSGAGGGPSSQHCSLKETIDLPCPDLSGPARPTPGRSSGEVAGWGLQQNPLQLGEGGVWDTKQAFGTGNREQQEAMTFPHSNTS